MTRQRNMLAGIRLAESQSLDLVSGWFLQLPLMCLLRCLYYNMGD